MSLRLHSRRDESAAFITKDGSTIRELMHPRVHGCAQQSLAEAMVAPGAVTALHRHARTEELYHILEGRGWMTLGDAQFETGPGDTIRIPPGTAHRIENRGAQPLRFLCCCTPAYRDDDTELIAAC